MKKNVEELSAIMTLPEIPVAQFVTFILLCLFA